MSDNKTNKDEDMDCTPDERDAAVTTTSSPKRTVDDLLNPSSPHSSSHSSSSSASKRLKFDLFNGASSELSILKNGSKMDARKEEPKPQPQPVTPTPTPSGGHGRQIQQCGRCGNHGLAIPVKGHKRFCDFRDCVCRRCLITAERQKVMAKQVAEKRAQKQDEARAAQGLFVRSSTSRGPESEPCVNNSPLWPGVNPGSSTPDIKLSPSSPERPKVIIAREEFKTTVITGTGAVKYVKIVNSASASAPGLDKPEIKSLTPKRPEDEDTPSPPARDTPPGRLEVRSRSKSTAAAVESSSDSKISAFGSGGKEGTKSRQRNSSGSPAPNLNLRNRRDGTNFMKEFMENPPMATQSTASSNTSSAHTSPINYPGLDPATGLRAIKIFPHFGLNGATSCELIFERVRESLHALIDKFRLPIETLHLVYLILKDSRFDFELASSRIAEAQSELNSIALREAVRMYHPYYGYCFYPPTAGPGSCS